jgi:hypothetical protein
MSIHAKRAAWFSTAIALVLVLILYRLLALAQRMVPVRALCGSRGRDSGER